MLKWADPGGQKGWTGGPKSAYKAEAPASCPGFRPKQADLVRVGSAATSYPHLTAGITISSGVAVMQTPTPRPGA